MTTLTTTAPGASAPAHPAATSLPSKLILLLATGTGLAVASIYYSQPMLSEIAANLGASHAAIGLVPTLTQLGYAFGILLLAPLGDKYNRKHLILIKATLLCLALLAAAAAPGIGVMLAASLIIGLTATMTQDIVPAAATLAPETHRGQVVGKVMTGLLMGILLSRVISGFVGEHFGWRSMFVGAAISIAAIGVAVQRGLPNFKPTTQMSISHLLGSLAKLWQKYPALRRAALAQGLMSVGFSAFWSTLAVMLHGAPYHLGSTVAGAFGLAGAAGALGAPIAGMVADRHGPERVTRLGAALAAVSFAAMLVTPWLSPTSSLVLIALSAIGFDLGVQISLIAHQTIVYGIEPAARSRLNTVLVTSMFVGMSTGAAVGALLLAHGGWVAVSALAMTASLGALAVRMWPAARR